MHFTLKTFQENCQQWATDRGIYEHSIALAQALKTDAENGEFSDAIIKNDMPAIKDGIGDIAVCVVNFAYLSNIVIDWNNIPAYQNTNEPIEIQRLAGNLTYHVGMLAAIVSGVVVEKALLDVVHNILGLLDALATSNGLTLIDCCQHAWDKIDKIKDRKGRMVEGKVVLSLKSNYSQIRKSGNSRI